MELLKIEHIQLAMPKGREDEASRFYGEALGLAWVPKPPQLAKNGGCWFKSHNLKIHLGVDPNFTPARKAHPAFLVTSIEDWIVRLSHHGVLTSPVSKIPGF